MKYHLLTALSAIILISGCTNVTPVEVPLPTVSSEVKITGTKTVLGSSDVYFAENSKIGIYMTTASNSLLPNGNLADNKEFTTDASGNFTSTTPLKYPVSGNVDFYAYAPYSSTALDASGNITFTVAANQSKLESSDLLWITKKGITAANTPTALTFDHKLSKIAITLTISAGATLSNPTLQILNTLPTTKLSMQNGTTSPAQGTAAAITACKISNSQMEAIIIPQTLSNGTKFLQITNGGKTFTYTLPSERIFEKGKSYSFEIKINDTSIDVKFTGTVNGWISGGEATSGDAI